MKKIGNVTQGKGFYAEVMESVEEREKGQIDFSLRRAIRLG